MGTWQQARQSRVEIVRKSCNANAVAVQSLQIRHGSHAALNVAGSGQRLHRDHGVVTVQCRTIVPRAHDHRTIFFTQMTI